MNKTLYLTKSLAGLQKVTAFKHTVAAILAVSVLFPSILISQESSEDVVELQEYEITGFREGLAKAMQEQKESVNFKEVLSSDSVGNLPDANVAEALQRLPGLYLQTDDGGGDGRWVSIRGVDPILNNVTMNGQQIAVSDVQGRSGRAAPLDILSASALASVDVVKVPTPDMDAQGLGGTIDIKTPSGFDHEGTYAFGGFKYGFNDFCGACDIYDGDLNFTTRLGADKQFAVYIGANYSFRDYKSHLAETQGFDNVTGIDSINGIEDEFVAGPMGADLRLGSALGSRERKGFSGNIEWQASENTKLWVRGYYTDWDEEELRPQISIRTNNLDPRWTVMTAPRMGFTNRGRIESETEYEVTERQVRQIVFGGKHRFNESWEVEGNVNFTLASEDRPDGILAQEEFSCDERSNAYDPDFACLEFDQTGFWPVLTLGPMGDELWPGEGDIGDLSFHPFFRLRRETSEVEEDRFEFDLNVKRDGKLFGHDGFIKSGVKYSTKDRFVSDRSMRYRRDQNPDDPTFFQSDYFGDLPYGILHANIGDLGPHSLGPKTGPNAGIYARQLGPVNNIAALRADFEANIGAAFDDTYDEIAGTPDPCAVMINPYCPDEGLYGPWAFDEEASRENGVEDDYFLTEDILAWYAMAELNIGEKLTVIGGIRVEWTDAHVGAWNSGSSYENPEAGGITLTQFEFDNDYSNIFPNLQIRYEASDSLVFRGAVSTSMGRPDYPVMAPIGKVSFEPVIDPEDGFTGFVTDGELEEGNPNLKPYEALNLDFSASYYFANGAGMLQVGYFYKDVENAIYGFSYDALQDNINLLGDEMSRGTATHPISGDTVDVVTFRGLNFIDEFNVSTFSNADPGQISGFEVTYQQNFTFLPAPLDGFGVVANFTFIDSEVSVSQRPGEKLPFFLQADDLYNLQFYYQKSGLEARLAYHYQGDSYKSVGSSVYSDLYWKERGYWDAKVSYQINRNINIYGEVKNITNEPVETYYYEPQYLGNDNGFEVYGTVFYVGMTWNFGN